MIFNVIRLQNNMMNEKGNIKKLKAVIKKAITIIGAILYACASQIRPTPEQLANPDCGPYPEKYEEIVKNYLNKALSDPYGIKDLEITEREVCWC